MLEQQQAWLVQGLQELYRRIVEGEGWPTDHMKLHPNGHPLIHYLLKRLGILDHGKGERFEEDPEALQQNLRRTNAGVQRQEFPEGESSTPRFTFVPSHFSLGPFSQHTMMPMPSTYIASNRTITKH
ncbi:hypothetical protein PCG10_003790 [Penicillium crustosum]|uniref:Uncharacterized protein n=1 Tax=Penicillium crustosum TaxID=36656 RepID=A0A9P5GQA0_PENCR|nr:uncharacterized protein N7487_009955 [Penicillium crustosum]KAF7526723.1 hypothetical protein PCG10_003790 [Penicillium crustosum]KAJ5395652.1 hypothetical protein N7487_009955 [Penicillium crustosum]